jgi:hypothetical protein
MFRFMKRFGSDSQARSRAAASMTRARRRNHPLNCEALESRQMLSGFYIANNHSAKVPIASDSAAVLTAVALGGSAHGSTRIQGSQTTLDGKGTVGALGAVTSQRLLTASGAEAVNASGTITFSCFSDGTYAYNSATSSWREITTDLPFPSAMSEGSNGTLFVSYASGTYRYDYSSNHWTQLTSDPANALSAASDNTLFASFNNLGTYEYNGSWHGLTSQAAANLAAVSNNDVYVSFSSGSDSGTWQYHSGWTQITPAIPYAMSASPGGALFASYRDGIWEYNGSWQQLGTSAATQIAAVSNSEFYATYTHYGTYAFDAGAFTQLTPLFASQLGTDGSTMIGSYESGTYTYDGNGHWSQITTLPALLVC